MLDSISYLLAAVCRCLFLSRKIGEQRWGKMCTKSGPRSLFLSHMHILLITLIIRSEFVPPLLNLSLSGHGSCKQEVSSSVRLCANLSFCLPLPGCPCSRSGAGSEMKPCQSSAGLRVAFSSTPEDLLAATRPRKEPWKWHGEPCRPPHLPLSLSLSLRMEAAEWTASGTSCVLLGCL